MNEVKYDTCGAVAHIKLNRPDALNAFTRRMFDEVTAARDRFVQDPDLKVAIISGEGRRAFSAGIDLKAYSADLEGGGSRRIPHPIQVDMAKGPEFCEKPLIAAIRGYCFGEGMHLALACDFRVCASDSVFALPEVAFGMAQTWLSWQCVRTMGMPAAAELCLLAERKDAAWALAHHLVHQVTLPGEEMTAAERIAERLCNLSYPAVLATKRTLYRAFDLDYGQMLEYSMPLRARVLDMGDDRTLTRAFATKRSG